MRRAGPSETFPRTSTSHGVAATSSTLSEFSELFPSPDFRSGSSAFDSNGSAVLYGLRPPYTVVHRRTGLGWKLSGDNS